MQNGQDPNGTFSGASRRANHIGQTKRSQLASGQQRNNAELCVPRKEADFRIFSPNFSRMFAECRRIPTFCRRLTFFCISGAPSKTMKYGEKDWAKASLPSKRTCFAGDKNINAKRCVLNCELPRRAHNRNRPTIIFHTSCSLAQSVSLQCPTSGISGH